MNNKIIFKKEISYLLKGYSLWKEDVKLGMILSHFKTDDRINNIAFIKSIFGKKQILKFTDDDKFKIENKKMIFLITENNLCNRNRRTAPYNREGESVNELEKDKLRKEARRLFENSNDVIWDCYQRRLKQIEKMR